VREPSLLGAERELMQATLLPGSLVVVAGGRKKKSKIGETNETKI